MRNPFKPFPAKPPARILLFGDPGTEKTRRALMQMPGPSALVDMEAGSLYYADIAQPGSVYLPTHAIGDVLDALTWLESPAASKIATVIIDPVTVIWEQLQEGFRARAVAKSKRSKYPKDAEDVIIDAGGWGRLNSLHAAMMTRLLNLPQHVVLIARGKETTDDNGVVTGYTCVAQKAVPFLASTVIRTRSDHDHVEKDRSGALREGRVKGRVDLGAIVKGSGSAVTRVEPGMAAAEREAAAGERWTDEERHAFCGALKKLGHGYDGVAAWAESLGLPRPSAMTRDQRLALYNQIKGDPADIAEWLATHDVSALGAAE